MGAEMLGIAVLGCRVRWLGAPTPTRILAGAAGRRVEAAAQVYTQASKDPRRGVVVVTSGGCRWEGVAEAGAMKDALVARGVPPTALVRELCSLSTRENARFSLPLLRDRGVTAVVVVTCDWHLPRALGHFRRELANLGPWGKCVQLGGHGAEEQGTTWPQRFGRHAREAGASLLDGFSDVFWQKTRDRGPPGRLG
jgi:uncharacterized SAM-binding protein YcdF (DUF218 family)